MHAAQLERFLFIKCVRMKCVARRVHSLRAVGICWANNVWILHRLCVLKKHTKCVHVVCVMDAMVSAVAHSCHAIP